MKFFKKIKEVARFFNESKKNKYAEQNIILAFQDMKMVERARDVENGLFFMNFYVEDTYSMTNYYSLDNEDGCLYTKVIEFDIEIINEVQELISRLNALYRYDNVLKIHYEECFVLVSSKTDLRLIGCSENDAYFFLYRHERMVISAIEALNKLKYQREEPFFIVADLLSNQTNTEDN